MSRSRSVRCVAMIVCGFAVVPLARVPTRAETAAAAQEWRSYGSDLASSKYSALAQIDRANFNSLALAWRWKSTDGFLSKTTASGAEWWGRAPGVLEELLKENPNRWRYQLGSAVQPPIGNMKVTPIMANGLLYLNTALSMAIALDARTGETVWMHNPKSYEVGTSALNMQFNVRGVSYWTDGKEERILWGTSDARLLCADAKSGRPCAGFGHDGQVDLYAGLPRGSRKDRDYLNGMLLSVTSPPLVVGRTVVVGSAVSDHRITKVSVPGWVRAYDVITGAQKWVFKTVPEAGEFGADTWKNDSWAYSGNTNVWTTMSADAELGYVYLPTSTPTSDYYGGHRLGDNLFAESLVCVDVETGKRIWYFQAVHHGLWDYDFPAAPNLVDITVDSRRVKAVAQVSKQGFIYAFDRVTGTPIWPIEERPVPTDTNLDGEIPSRTQPFPTRPAPFEYQGVTIEDLVDFTPELRRLAVEAVKEFRIGPLFTPPMMAEKGGLKGTIARPSSGGGANWSGAGVDPDTGILYVPSRNAFSVASLQKPLSGDADLKYAVVDPRAQRDAGSMPEGSRNQPRMPDGLPLFKPPYSRMTAVDMNTGRQVWMVPTGNGDRIRRNPRLQDLNLPALGGDASRTGPLVTRTLLIYALDAGGTHDGPRLVAYDKATGRELGSVDLPAVALGTPMTYMVDGRQYIALAIAASPPEVIALALL